MNQISKNLFSRAQKVIPGGVNSPVRAFRGVGGEPLFITRADGPYIFDADGRRYIDYVGSWGPMVLGHNSPVVRDAVARALESGTSFGAPTEIEVQMAEFITANLPNMDMVRMVSSGTEATMSAIRLARGFTGRKHIIKFNGCYHGHADSLLVAAGSGVATLGIAGCPGVPEEIASLTASIEFNDLGLLENTVKSIGAEKVAAIIIEPVPGNMGLIPALPGYLQGVRELCDRSGIILILDEVMSGFRVAFGGAQERFNIRGDLITYGKVIGGGLPVGAFGGRRDIMSKLAPLGPVYQAGTLSGNPLAMTAGLAALSVLKLTNPYPKLEEQSRILTAGLLNAAAAHALPLTAQSVGSMFGLFFSAEPVTNYLQATQSDTERFKRFFHAMLAEGIYLAPSAFEAGFLSTEHSADVISETIGAAERVFTQLVGR